MERHWQNWGWLSLDGTAGLQARNDALVGGVCWEEGYAHEQPSTSTAGAGDLGSSAFAGLPQA